MTKTAAKKARLAAAAKAAPAPAKKAAAPAAKKAPAPAKSKSPVAALAKRIAALLDTNKGESITTIALEDCSFADYMIVASGRAPRHVSALADYVTDMLKKDGNPPLSVEGKESGDWVLIDAGDIVIHIFRPEIRQFYNIEKMWTLPAVSR